MIDGCYEAFDHVAYLKRIEKERPNWLVMEAATMTYADDLRLAQDVREKFGTKLIFTGQHVTGDPESASQEVDYVCLGEYEMTVLDIIRGKAKEDILGLYPNALRDSIDLEMLPFPEDEDISRLNYRANPQTSEYLEIEVFASRGCPMACTFCVAGNLYYSKNVWRPRKVDNIIAEIKYLKEKYWPTMEGIYFNEEYHNANKAFIIELTRAIVENGLNDLKYEAMGGYRAADLEVLEAMKIAGYYKLRVGIESASDKVGKAIRKKLNMSKLTRFLEDAKAVGLHIYGTFMIGAPGSTAEEDLNTIRLIRGLLVENLLYDSQISICTPQFGTPFYKWAKESGYLVTDDFRCYNGVSAVVSYPDYPAEKIEEIHKFAKSVEAKYRMKRGYHSDFAGLGKDYKYRDEKPLQGIPGILVRNFRRRGVIRTFVAIPGALVNRIALWRKEKELL